MKSSIFWDRTPCSPLKVNRRFVGTYCHHNHGLKVSYVRTLLVPKCWFLALILKMEATCSSETSADFQRATRHYIPLERTLQIKIFFPLVGRDFCLDWGTLLSPEHRGSLRYIQVYISTMITLLF
jgi:hypothetical protein